MKIIVLLVGYETTIETESPARPHGLLNLAGNSILGHILRQLDDVLADEVVLVVKAAQEQLFTNWMAQNYPELTVHFIIQQDTESIGYDLQNYADYFDENPLLLVSGHAIVEADFIQLPRIAANENATAVTITNANENTSTGIFWLRRGMLLQSILAAQPINQISDLLAALQANGTVVAKTAAAFCLDTRTTTDCFYANRRLLGLGYGSQDVIERSYADDFTVLPPVFLHETAVVENSVIGPFVNIEANAVVQNSIVKNSIIDADAHVQTAILANSLIGEGAHVNGRSQCLIVPDDPACMTVKRHP